MRRNALIVRTSFVVLVGLAPAASADRAPIVAVFGIEAKRVTLKTGAVDALSEYLANRLAASGVYQVIPCDAMGAKLSEQRRASHKTCYDQSCQIEIGRQLAAQKSLAAQVMKIGSQCVVTVTLYDLRTATTEKAANAKGECTEDRIMATMDQVVNLLIADTKLRPAALPEPAQPPHTQAPPPALQATKVSAPEVQAAPAAPMTAAVVAREQTPALGHRTAAAPPEVKPGSRDGSPMVRVPAGAFLRGSLPGEGQDDERPQRSVELDAFLIDKYTVSVAQYRRCVDAGACLQPEVGTECNWGRSGREDHPVNCVDWDQAKAYCAWAGRRLPTEAEWEKAARGTDGRKYPWGNAALDCQRAAYEDCHEQTVPVRWHSGAASPYGAVQMVGNVWQWTADWYDKVYYKASPAKNPKGPSSGSERVLRGGSWYDFARGTRAADRGRLPPSYRLYGRVGFRCASSP